MSELNQKLDHFTATILAEATAETERTLADLKEKRSTAFSAAEDKILAETYHYIRTEVARVKSEAGRQVSRRMLDAKKELFLRRGQIADEVFALVREKIVAYTQTDAYPRRLKALFLDAVETLKEGDDIRVYLRKADMAQADALSAALPGMDFEFREGAFLLGGLVAESSSLGRRVDSTFDSALEELNGHFAELFGLSLANVQKDAQEVEEA